MNYIFANQNTLIWFCFIVYALMTVVIVPPAFKSSLDKNITVDNSHQPELKFATGLVLRLALIFPWLILLKNLV